jgi:uncharacterized protein YbjT (DUF2867 family)
LKPSYPDIDYLQEPQSQEPTHNGVTWRRLNYKDKNDLVNALQGIHTVLSFIQTLQDEGNTAQKNLIDACVLAGVKRFAPSEWAR